MLTVLNDPAAGARTRSGSDRARTASSAQRSTSPRAASIRTGTTSTGSASRRPGCRPFVTAALDESACPASSRSCILTRRTTAAREPRRASVTGSCTSRPSYPGRPRRSRAAVRRRSRPGRKAEGATNRCLARRHGRADKRAECAEIAVVVADASVAQESLRRPPKHGRHQGGRAGARLSRGARAGTDACATPRKDRGHRPFHDHPPLPMGVRDEPRPLPDAAPAGARASRDRERADTRPSRCRGGFRRPEPHVATVQADLWTDADPVAGAHRSIVDRTSRDQCWCL